MSGAAAGAERPEQQQRVRPPGPALPVSAVGQNRLLQVLIQGDPAEPSAELQRAQEQWEALEQTQAGLGGPLAAAPPPISFQEALQFFQSADLSQCRRQARVPGGAHGLAVLLRCLTGPPRLRRRLREERELVLAMANCALDDTEWVHMRILQTIYTQLTRSRLSCPRYGPHWEELGFQELPVLHYVHQHHPHGGAGPAGGPALQGVQPAAGGDRRDQRPLRRRLPAALPRLEAAAQNHRRLRSPPPRAGIIHQKETEAAAEGPADLREPSASLLTLRGRGNQLHGHLRSAHRAGLRHIGGRSEATVTPLATWEAPRWPVQSGDGFGSRGHHHKSICLAQNPPKWWRSPSLRVCGSEGGKRCLRLVRPSVRTPRFCLSSARIQSPMVAPEWNRDSGSTLGGDTFNLSPWLGRGLLVPPQVSL
ncbi:ELMO domain-containing protein 3 isoform X2 [Columba livia]